MYLHEKVHIKILGVLVVVKYNRENLSVPGANKVRIWYILGASEITANLYCNCVHLYWEGCVICSLYLR